MLGSKSIHIYSLKSLIRKSKLVILAIFLLFFESNFAFSAETPGVDPAIKKALTYKAQAAIGYEKAANSAMLDMPSSVSAITCFDQAATAAADVAGEIFSGKISEHSSKAVSNSLKSHYENFQWDKIISYDKELNVNASLSMDVSLGIGNTEGPTVKHVECESGALLWDAKNKKATGAYPSLAEAIAQRDALAANEAVVGQEAASEGAQTLNEKFIAEWSADSNDGLAALDALDQLEAEEPTLKQRFQAMDRTFNEDINNPSQMDSCGLLKEMSGSDFDCDKIR